MDKIEDDIEEDREGRSKDEMDEKFFIKTVPNCKNIFGSEIDQGLYVHCTKGNSQGSCMYKYFGNVFMVKMTNFM